MLNLPLAPIPRPLGSTGSWLEVSPRPLKAPKPIAKRSDKQKARQAILAKRCKDAKANGQRCAVNAPGICTGEIEGTSHKLKRSQGRDDSPENAPPACNACNRHLETPEGRVWGIANGFVIERRSLLSNLRPSGSLGGVA